MSGILILSTTYQNEFEPPVTLTQVVCARQPFHAYAGYAYTEGVAERGDTTVRFDSWGVADERLQRKARLIRFCNITGLCVVNSRGCGMPPEFAHIPLLRNANHVSYWVDDKGVRFVMVEPYKPKADILAVIQARNLTALIVPPVLGIYQGGRRQYGNTGTTSVLFTDEVNTAALGQVKSSLWAALERATYAT